MTKLQNYEELLEAYFDENMDFSGAKTKRIDSNIILLIYYLIHMIIVIILKKKNLLMKHPKVIQHQKVMMIHQPCHY